VITTHIVIVVIVILAVTVIPRVIARIWLKDLEITHPYLMIILLAGMSVVAIVYGILGSWPDLLILGPLGLIFSGVKLRQQLRNDSRMEQQHPSRDCQ
jgi:hypothetical protein